MGDRGFQSSEALSVAAVSLPGQRPQVPDELNADQADVWRRIVGRMPPDWFSPENFDLLGDYCRHVVRARQLDETITRLMSDEEWSDDIGKLLAAAKVETSAMVSLATKMRLTQQSRYRADKADPAVRKEAGKQDLWSRKAA